MARFALTGVSGFVAPRHLDAIKAVEGTLVAALDPHDAAGVLDKYNRSVDFFTDPARFERHLAKLQHDGKGIEWLSVCSPNHLHDVHARIGLHAGANVLCEKPLTLSPWNLDVLEDAERLTGKRVYTVLQLRLLPELQKLQRRLGTLDRRSCVELHYATPRGRWYQHSWKGDPEKSGGLITNIGIHLLDLLLWMFGTVDQVRVTQRTDTRAAGTLTQRHADVAWYLSIDADTSMRRLIVDGETIDFTDGFDGLHTRVYEQTLAGNGFGIPVARPAVELAHRLRYYPVR